MRVSELIEQLVAQGAVTDTDPEVFFLDRFGELATDLGDAVFDSITGAVIVREKGAS